MERRGAWAWAGLCETRHHQAARRASALFGAVRASYVRARSGRGTPNASPHGEFKPAVLAWIFHTSHSEKNDTENDERRTTNHGSNYAANLRPGIHAAALAYCKRHICASLASPLMTAFSVLGRPATSGPCRSERRCASSHGCLHLRLCNHFAARHLQKHMLAIDLARKHGSRSLSPPQIDDRSALYMASVLVFLLSLLLPVDRVGRPLRPGSAIRVCRVRSVEASTGNRVA